MGRELGVRYVVEGSMRAIDKRARISTQLVEAESGKQIWTQRFDVDLAETFDLQDEITETLATTLEPEITMAEIERAKRQRADDVTAWDHYLRALPDFHQLTREANGRAIEHLRKAISLDASFWKRPARLWPLAPWRRRRADNRLRERR